MNSLVSVTNVGHSLLDGYAGARHAGDSGHSGRVKCEVRANALPIAFRSAFQKQGPIASCQWRVDTGALCAGGLQLANQGHKAGVKFRCEYLGMLCVKRDALGGNIDVAQGKAGFAETTSLVKGDFERDRHPPHRKGQVAFLRDQGLADCGDVGLAHLRFFRWPMTFDAHSLKWVGRDEFAVRGLAHNARQEPQFSQRRIMGRVALRDSLYLACAGGDVLQAKRVGDAERTVNLSLGKEGVDPLPSVALGNEGLGAIVVLHFQPGRDPVFPTGIWRDGSGRDSISRKFPGHRDGAFVPESVVPAMSTALGAEAQAFGAPIFDPPIRGVFSGINTCASQGHLSVAERSYGHFSIKNDHS